MHSLTTLFVEINPPSPPSPASPLNTDCCIQLAFSKGDEGRRRDWGAGEPPLSWEPGAVPEPAERSGDSVPAPSGDASPQGTEHLEPLKLIELTAARLRIEHPLCEEDGWMKKVSSFVFLSCLPQSL